VARTRWVGDQESFEVSDYIGSRHASAEELGSAAREHWGIENGLHWVLDVIFREDDSHLKDRIAAENVGMLRRRNSRSVKGKSSLWTHSEEKGWAEA
jgi:predicted transposase YbfD/YdcC